MFRLKLQNGTALAGGAILLPLLVLAGMQATRLPPQSSLVSVSGRIETMLVLDCQSTEACEGQPIGRIELRLEGTEAGFVSKFPECSRKLAAGLSIGEPVTIWVEAPGAVQQSKERECDPGQITGILEIRKLQARGQMLVTYEDSARLQGEERLAFLLLSGLIGVPLGVFFLARGRRSP